MFPGLVARLDVLLQSLKTPPKLVPWTGGVKNPPFRRLG